MESEFIALDKVGEEAEWLRHFLKDIPYGQSLCHLFVYIVIVSQQWVEHKAICLMVSHGIYTVATTPLNT